MEYGNLESIYHSGEIAKPTHLTLHAALGCASGAAAVAIAVGTGGLGSGISGAMMTAAATTTAATTASVAATNTSMNSDGDIFKQIKDVNKDAWDASTSRESVENMAIAAAVAGAGSYLGEHISNVKADYANSTGSQVSEGGSSIFDQNTVNAGYSNSKLGINSEYIINPATKR